MSARSRRLLGLIVTGWVAAMIAVWLTDPRFGAVLAFAIGAVGVGVAVHPDRTGSYTERRDSTLDRYGLAALAVLLGTGVATLRAFPRRPAGATTIPAPRAHPDR